MELGNFSISLAVKSLTDSKQFYGKLGFRVVHGDGNKWVIMQNSTATIGLFEGMFDRNIMTFNPGWDRSGGNVDPFEDVRSIQETLKANGIQLQTEAGADTTGPAHVVFTDPDGNVIMLDQHR